MKINPSIFREYDIRGIAEKDLSAELAEALGRAYARYIQIKKPEIQNPKIGLGKDCRLTGDKYADALMKGLLDSGIDVVRIGTCPTPLTYFSIFHLKLDGAIMVTGSHNPADYNGFKICVGKETLHGEHIQELRKLIEADERRKTSRVGTKSSYEIIPAYIDHVAKNTKPLKRKKIVIDAGNGTAGNVAPELFRRLGADVVELFCELDGRFPNHHPDPTVHENLKDMVAKIKSEKADFGLAFDGDSDRVGFVDEKGRIAFGDEFMVILSRAVLKERPGATIISEVKSSNRLYQEIEKCGGKPLMWKTGHSLIKSKMKETGALLAGEMSGHIFFADRYFGYDDGIYAGVRAYEIISDHSGPASSLLAGLSPVVATPELRVDCSEELKFSLVQETKKILASKKCPINDIDGVRVDFPDGWGLVRASNTQPVLVLRFEAVNKARLDEIEALVRTALKEAALKIGHAPLN